MSILIWYVRLGVLRGTFVSDINDNGGLRRPTRARTFTDLCFQADIAFFFGLQGESTYIIGVGDPSELDLVQFCQRIDFRFPEGFVLVHEADEVFHLAVSPNADLRLL